MTAKNQAVKARHVPLGRSLLRWFITLAVVPLIVLSSFSYYYMSRGLLESSVENLSVSSDQNLVFIQSWIDFQTADIRSLSRMNVIRSLVEHSSVQTETSERVDTRRVLNILSDFKLAHRNVLSIVLTNAQGVVLTSDASSIETSDLLRDPKVKTALSSAIQLNRMTFSDLIRVTDSVSLGFVVMPITHANGHVLGAMVVQLSLDQLATNFSRQQINYLVATDGKLRSAVPGSDYQVLGRPIDMEVSENLSWSMLDFYCNEAHMSEKGFPIEKFLGVHGQLTVGVRRPINVFGQEWFYVAEVDYDQIVSPARDAALVTAWLLFVLVIGVSAIALWLSRRITGPIESLTRLSESVISGDIKKRSELQVNNEFGVLARHLNLMLDVRQKHEGIIQKSYSDSEEALLALNQQKYALDQHSIVEIADLEGIITFVNSKCEEITGYTAEELRGNSYSLLNSGEHSDEFWAAMHQTLSNEGVWRGEICNRSKNGGFYWVDTTIAPFMRDGRPESYIVIRNDITLAKLTESELIEAKNAAEDGTKAKSDFLASMSHEIRTPMNGVLGMLNLLMKTSLDDAQRRQVQLAYGSAESLLTIINDILDFSKIEAGKLELEMMDFHLRDMLSEFAASIAPRIYEKDLEFVLDLTAIDRDLVKGDPGRLRQILINLVGNAIKFTESGEITVQASLLESYNKRLKLECVVRDTGIGIPESKQSQLFDSFSQVDASTTRKYGGTGLGLTIVKQLCELMGGQIFVESELEQGSAFTFSIYFDPADDARLLADEGEALIGQKVLVVDNNATFVSNLCQQLDAWQVAATAIDSTEAWHSFLNQFGDGVSNIDVMLVKQCRDGERIELIDTIMADERFRWVPKVALTPLSTMVSLEDLRADDFQAGITKPCAPEELLRTLVYLVLGQSDQFSLEDLVASEKASVKSIREALTGIGEATRILLVEDNPVNQIVASALLAQVGLSCDMAGNGKEAITALRRSPENSLYDLILMDCQMPELDGYEATRHIREGLAGERYKDVCIIAMTANAMKGDREKCLGAGMNDYVSKPVSAESLEQTLARWLLSEDGENPSNISSVAESQSSERRNTENEGHIMSSSNDANPASKVSAFQSGEPIWDKQSALDNLAGSEEIYDSLLEASLLDIPENIERLEQSITDSDLEMARISAHSVKGVAASIGAMVLMEVAKQAEMAAREQNLEEVSTFIPSIIESFNEFKEAIDA